MSTTTAPLEPGTGQDDGDDPPELATQAMKDSAGDATPSTVTSRTGRLTRSALPWPRPRALPWG